MYVENLYLTLSLVRELIWCWQVVQRWIQRADIYRHQKWWKKFTNRSKTGQYPQGKNQLHSKGHNLHVYELESFALLSVSYKLQSCKIAQRQGKTEIMQRRLPGWTPESFWFLSKPLKTVLSFVHCFLPTALQSAHNISEALKFLLSVLQNRQKGGCTIYYYRKDTP